MNDVVVPFTGTSRIVPAQSPLSLSLRISHNHQKSVRDAIISGADNFNGVILDATKGHVQRELRAEALSRGMDAALDPMTPQLAYEHKLTDSLTELPWGTDGPQRLHDYRDDQGRRKTAELFNVVIRDGYTQVMAHTHVISGPNDPWLHVDIANAQYLAGLRDAQSNRVEIIYPLVLTMEVFKDSVFMDAIATALENAPIDILQFRIANFSWDASGTKTRDYILAARRLHDLNVPIVADMVGGVSGLALAAFGAVGGISHGVTLSQSFGISAWQRPSNGEGRAQPPRVYLQNLDLCVKKAEAEIYFANQSIARRHICRDTHCCTGGRQSMMNNPTRHFMRQRTREISELGQVPPAMRSQAFLDQTIRPISDRLTAAANIDLGNEVLEKRLHKHSVRMSKMRDLVAHLIASDEIGGQALSPLRRSERTA